MGYWGWRRLLAVFISVWVVGCSITHDAAPTISPTQLPKVTLTQAILASPTPANTPQMPPAEPTAAVPTPILYTVQPGDTLLQIALRFGVGLPVLQAANNGIEPRSLQIGQQLTIPEPVFDAQGMPILATTTPLALNVSPPNCYATPTNSILCLGQVTNPLADAVERVTVRVRLLKGDGALLAEGQASMEQSVIPAGGSAPYRVLLKADWNEYARAEAILKSADRATGAAPLVSLDVIDEGRQLADGQYAISAVLYNPDSQPAQLHRIIVMLNDALGQITGYRVVQLNYLLTADERLPFEIAVLPHDADATIDHVLYVEAVRAPTVTPG